MLLPAVTKPSPMSWASRAYGMAPAYPPVPLTFMRPVQSAAFGGSQTSNLISESDDGRATPSTRQVGTVTVAPPIVAGGDTRAAAVIVASAVVIATRPAQLVAACTPALSPASTSATA